MVHPVWGWEAKATIPKLKGTNDSVTCRLLDSKRGEESHRGSVGKFQGGQGRFGWWFFQELHSLGLEEFTKKRAWRNSTKYGLKKDIWEGGGKIAHQPLGSRKMNHDAVSGTKVGHAKERKTPVRKDDHGREPAFGRGCEKKKKKRMKETGDKVALERIRLYLAF